MYFIVFLWYICRSLEAQGLICCPRISQMTSLRQIFQEIDVEQGNQLTIQALEDALEENKLGHSAS